MRWLESQHAAARGDETAAAALEGQLAEAGFGPAREARVQRRLATARKQFESAGPEAAAATLRGALAETPEARDPRFALAALLVEAEEPVAAAGELRALLERYPADAEAWNLMGALHGRAGRRSDAAQALDRSLAADPFFPQALANAGLVALQRGDVRGARHMLRRLKALAPLGAHPEEVALQAALRGEERR